MVVKINLHGVKNLFIFSPVTRAISVSATRAMVTLSSDWLAFAVKLVLVGNLTREISRVPNWLVRLGTAYCEAKGQSVLTV